MRRLAAAVLAAALATGCGTYRIAYRFPSQEAAAQPIPVKRNHAHGIGLGLGAYFFILHQMFPALIDYEGDQSVAEICPNGVYEVSHHHRFWHNAAAAFISYLVGVNAYHMSEVQWLCVAAPPSPSPNVLAPQASPAPTAP